LNQNYVKKAGIARRLLHSCFYFKGKVRSLALKYPSFE
jgi:hypothetical protein